MERVEVSSLHYYPVKSCAGTTEKTLEVGEKGFAFDRHWMIVDSEGRFLTQRELSRMALITPTVDSQNGILTLSGKNESSILDVPLNNSGEILNVIVWKSSLGAVDEGNVASQWLSDFLDTKCRLVHMDSAVTRSKNGARLQFADSYPFLIVSEESLQDLNIRIEANGGNSVPLDRFRPNIVVKGVEPYAEDSWDEIQINDVRFDVVKPCVRCPIPQIDQKTGSKGKEPTKTLLGYRRVSQKEVVFAQKASHLNQGIVSVGDTVLVINDKEPPFLK